jgi:hypothetical protein
LTIELVLVECSHSFIRELLTSRQSTSSICNTVCCLLSSLEREKFPKKPHLWKSYPSQTTDKILYVTHPLVRSSCVQLFCPSPPLTHSFIDTVFESFDPSITTQPMPSHCIHVDLFHVLKVSVWRQFVSVVLSICLS